MSTGALYVISAPSGAGKTSLVSALVASMPGVEVSISHTTRRCRPGEQDGRHYHFVDVNRFRRMIDEGAFLEYAQVFDNFYGTARAQVMAKLEQGVDVILEIDWQGARQIRAAMPECVSLFILPPSRRVLEERLSKRGQDDVRVIARRMRDAVNELSHYNEFDFLVLNDDFEAALAELRSIIQAGRLATPKRARELQALISDLLRSAEE